MCLVIVITKYSITYLGYFDSIMFSCKVIINNALDHFFRYNRPNQFLAITQSLLVPMCVGCPPGTLPNYGKTKCGIVGAFQPVYCYFVFKVEKHVFGII